MAVKTKSDLKSVFNEPASLLFQTTDFNFGETGVALSPEYDLPVHVDDLTISQDAPTVNHYKVIGFDGDWATSAESGDFNVNFFVPSSHEDVYKLAFGSGAVSSLSMPSSGLMASADLSALGLNALSAASWDIFGVDTKKHKVNGYFALINSSDDHIVLFRDVALYATIEWNDTSTAPLGVRFTGTVLDSGSGNNVIHMAKVS